MLPTRLPFLGDACIAQIGILVPDLESALSSYVDRWRVGPWKAWTYDQGFIRSSTYRGAPGEYAMRLALCDTEPQLELIESLTGPSIYAEWADSGRFGIHHLGIRVPGIAASIDEMRGRGFEPVQTGVGYGLDGDGGFAYFDLTNELGFIVELIEVPGRRREPAAIYEGGRLSASAAARR